MLARVNDVSMVRLETVFESKRRDYPELMDQRMMPQRRAGAPAPRARRARTARGIRARACVPESIESGILDLLGDIRFRLLV